MSGKLAESYGYDAVGNRTSSLDAASLLYNISNELTSSSNATFSYDANGNMLTKTTSTAVNSYTWDVENRLVSALVAPADPAKQPTAVSFKYDPFGHRIFKSSAAGTTIYAYDGANAVAEYSASGAVTASYAQGLGVDEPLAMQRGGAAYYYNADGLGSITSLTNAAGVVKQSYVYDNFGATTASTSLVNPYQYTSREYDSETGLYYYRARYYDPQIGRFISGDPLGFAGSGTNFHAYVGNNPVNSIDPLGQTKVTSPGWFPGATGRNSKGNYTANVDDGSDETTVLQRLTLDDVEKEERKLACRLKALESQSGGVRDRRGESGFDTQWYLDNGNQRKYYYVEGMDQIYSDKEINYIGIGMYEAWLGDSLIKAQEITLAWKVSKYYHFPSSGTYYWVASGYNAYLHLNGIGAFGGGGGGAF